MESDDVQLTRTLRQALDRVNNIVFRQEAQLRQLEAAFPNSPTQSVGMLAMSMTDFLASARKTGGALEAALNSSTASNKQPDYQ